MMKIEEVITPEAERQFLLFPVKLYKDSPHWIRPLDKDILNVFDKEKNKAFRHGEVIRWLLKNEEGVMLGRVAAFFDKKTAKIGRASCRERVCTLV